MSPPCQKNLALFSVLFVRGIITPDRTRKAGRGRGGVHITITIATLSKSVGTGSSFRSLNTVAKSTWQQVALQTARDKPLRLVVVGEFRCLHVHVQSAAMFLPYVQGSFVQREVGLDVPAKKILEVPWQH